MRDEYANQSDCTHPRGECKNTVMLENTKRAKVLCKNPGRAYNFACSSTDFHENKFVCQCKKYRAHLFYL